MDVNLYLQHKNWILQSVYEYQILNKEDYIMPLREYISCECFDGMDYRDIDEIYAASYFMWFSLYRIHEFSIDETHVNQIEKIIDYLRAENEASGNIINDDILELQQIKKYVLENAKSEKLDFKNFMRKINQTLFINGTPTFLRYGKPNNNANLKIVEKIMLNSVSNCAEKFSCLANYFIICMYNEHKPSSKIMNHLTEYFNQFSDDVIIKSFKVADENEVREYIGFLRRRKINDAGMEKNDFLNILEKKNIQYNAGNYVDRVEVGNIIIAMNTTVGNDTKIPAWYIKIGENKIYHTIALFDNRSDAYKFFLENFT